MADTLTIARRFGGPADSGNGGCACSVVASLLAGDTEVTPRSPPPLDQPLAIGRTDAGVRVTIGAQLVAEARACVVPIDAPPPPTPKRGEARE